MSKRNAFKFIKKDDLSIQKNALIVLMPMGITSKEELLNTIDEKMMLPDYFGYNWDALFECLRDLHWLEERLVVIFHQDLPQLEDEELKKYLDVLADATSDWESNNEHQLEVYFDEELESRILDLMSREFE